MLHEGNVIVQKALEKMSLKAEIDGKKSDKTYIPREVANPDTKDYEVEVRYEVAYSTATEEKVITLTKERGFVTRKEVEIFLGIGQSSCGRLLRKMAENGQILQEGKGKNTHYCLPK